MGKSKKSKDRKPRARKQPEPRKKAEARIQKTANDISLSAVCEGCGTNFRISTAEAMVQVQHKKEYEVNGQSIFLTYYDCPECGRRHYVQIDDRKTLNELKVVSRQFVRLSVARKLGKTIPKSQTDAFKKKRQDLLQLRSDLKKRFTGTVLVDKDTGVEFALRFSL